MADVIAVLSLKGGTGKTTAVRTLAAAFTEYAGLGVLAVDLDPQGNLSDYFDAPSDAAPTIADVLAGKATVADAIHDGVVPSSPALSEVERELAGRMGRELVLRRALEPVRDDYDVILLDCPPALGLLAVNGVVAADWALFSSEAQYFAVQGVQTALDVVQQAQEVYSPGLQWLGIVMNIADMRTRHSRDAYDQLAEHYPERVFETVVRSSIAYAESAEQARSILETRPDLGTDYLSLGAEVLERIGRRAPARKLRRAVAS